jgi:hypothetical protein
MPRRTVRRESNVGLIVTLIFFILTSVGLGVATYYGFTQQADLTNKAAAADKSRAEADKKTEWYQWQALYLRTCLGQTTGLDQPSDPKLEKSLTYAALQQEGRKKYDKGEFNSFPDKAGVDATVAAIEGPTYLVVQSTDKNGKPIPPQPPPVPVSMAVDKEKLEPKTTLFAIYWGLRNFLDDQTKQTNAAVSAQGTAEANAKMSETNANDWKSKYDAAAKALEETKKTADQTADKANAQLRLDLAKALQDAADNKGKIADAQAQGTKDLKAKDQTINELKGRIADLNDRLALETQKTVETPSEGKPIPTDWKIVRMDRSGKQPFVNLGSAQGVRAGLTFSIHGQGPDGRPLPASKGTLEILDVGEGQSQAQVVSVKDAFKDPILPGDYLYNPIFKPGGAQHVVIAGRIDMHGNKGDDLEEFERLLQRQNVVVDGYMDPQDGSIKGKLTVGADYLVLGDLSDIKEMTPAADSVKKLQDQARNNGVRIVPAREFLELMGYRTP